MLALALLACGRAAAPRPNVVLIVVDALRADRLGAYGNRDGLTPFLDGLAARATVFRRAYAQAPWTNPSVASLWTSRYPSQHGVVAFGSVLRDDEVTLAERLQAAGYATAGFSGNGVLAAGDGFAQGFDTYVADTPPDPSEDIFRRLPPRADALARKALAWLDGLSAAPPRPVFLYLQLMETHMPYAPPEDLLAARFAGRARPDLGAVADRMGLARRYAPAPEDLPLFETLYDLEVRSVDRELRALFDALERRGLLRDALVVVTADHGEEFHEHGDWWHGTALYDEQIHVPLLVIAPGQTRRRDVDASVALIDVAPTVLAWARAAVPPSFMGRMLPDAAPPDPRPWPERLLARAPAPGPERPVVSELLATPFPSMERTVAHQRAIRRGPFKLIAGVDGERWWFDVAKDPGELAPDGVAAPERAALLADLDAFLARIAQDAAPRRPAPVLDPETSARLRALGYGD